MIRYLKHSEIDKQKWDKCIRRSVNGIIYANSWYLDLFSENWDALVENEYERVFPLTWRKKFGIHYLYQPVFTQQLGVFSRNILSTEVVQSFLEAIPPKFKFAEINLNSYNKLDSSSIEKQEMLNHELDLIKTYDQHYRSYSTNLKRNLKKAAGSGLTIMKTMKPEPIIEMFRMNRGRNIGSLKNEDYMKLQRLMYTCIYKDRGQIWGAFNKYNELVAGAFFLISNNKVIFLFSGTNKKARELRAMPLLIDTFIRQNSRTNLTFDFEGSNDENLARFYKSFGSKEIRYLHIKLNRLSPLTKSILKLYQSIKPG